MSRHGCNSFLNYRRTVWASFILTLVLFSELNHALAARNITVDDMDDRIIYSPVEAWYSVNSSLSAVMLHLQKKQITDLTDRIGSTSHYTVST